jgi:hypothetical protein
MIFSSIAMQWKKLHSTMHDFGNYSQQKFIPISIDEIAIMHDLESIFALTEIPITSLTVADEVSPFSDAILEEEVAYTEDGTVVETPKPTISSGIHSRDFKITFTSSYEAMKETMSRIEASPVLLEVVDFTLKPALADTESDIKAPSSKVKQAGYTFEVTLRAFGLTASS